MNRLGLGFSFRTMLSICVVIVINAKYNKLFIFNCSLKKSLL